MPGNDPLVAKVDAEKVPFSLMSHWCCVRLRLMVLCLLQSNVLISHRLTATGACTSSLATELATDIAGHSGRNPLYVEENASNLNALPRFLGSTYTANNAALLCEAD